MGCLPWFALDEVPPGLESLGLCARLDAGLGAVVTGVVPAVAVLVARIVRAAEAEIALPVVVVVGLSGPDRRSTACDRHDQDISMDPRG